ncbi:hypothetical protein I4U23_019118 [Adineta vaga]|nr:hypothetical protein I4U23_019118 [Adineta vaga]
MANFDTAKAIFSQVDTNQDGSIDRKEFQNWISNTGTSSPSSHEASTSETVLNKDSTNKAGLSGYEASSRSIFESFSGNNNQNSRSVPTTINSGGQMNSATIETTSAQETSEYLSRTGTGIYNDPNPEIIRRTSTQGPITYQQKISIRFLQPPPVPPPGPLIIKEIRPPQPPPPPPLVVRQRAPPLPSLPPLILRERPPIAPPSVGSQTVIRHLNAMPAPPRSVIVERLPPPPPKPRDIIIERWIPYGSQAKRRTIVQRASAAIQYPQPRNIIVVYDDIQTRVVRQFERLGVTQEDPQAYVARYGATLLDTAQLIQKARTAGVIEDISPPTVRSSFSVGTEGISTAQRFSNTTQGRGFASSSSALNPTIFDGLQVVGDLEPNVYNFESTTNGSSTYSSSSSSNFINESALAESVGIGSSDFDVIAASFVAADTNHDGQLSRAEFQRFFQGGI